MSKCIWYSPRRFRFAAEIRNFYPFYRQKRKARTSKSLRLAFFGAAALMAQPISAKAAAKSIVVSVSVKSVVSGSRACAFLCDLHVVGSEHVRVSRNGLHVSVDSVDNSA